MSWERGEPQDIVYPQFRDWDQREILLLYAPSCSWGVFLPKPARLVSVVVLESRRLVALETSTSGLRLICLDWLRTSCSP